MVQGSAVLVGTSISTCEHFHRKISVKRSIPYEQYRGFICRSTDSALTVNNYVRESMIMLLVIHGISHVSGLIADLDSARVTTTRLFRGVTDFTATVRLLLSL